MCTWRDVENCRGGGWAISFLTMLSADSILQGASPLHVLGKGKRKVKLLAHLLNKERKKQTKKLEYIFFTTLDISLSKKQDFCPDRMNVAEGA